MALGSSLANAQISPLDTDLGDAYYYVDHFDIAIDRPIKDVWPHILAMSSWMPWMAGTDSESPTVSEGDRINLYGDFYVEVVKVIPENMILIVNWPVAEGGEETQGIAMVTAKESGCRTLVSIFMSRIFYWFEGEENPQRMTKKSPDFVNSRRSTFKDNFLVQLKTLAEGS